MKEVIEDLKRSIECTKSYGLTSIKIQQEEQLIDYVKELHQRIDNAIEYIHNASYFDGSSMCANDLLKILGDKE